MPETQYYADGGTVHKGSVETRRENGLSTVSLGFPVCTMSEWVGPDAAEHVAAALNAYESPEAPEALAEAERRYIDALMAASSAAREGAAPSSWPAHIKRVLDEVLEPLRASSGSADEDDVFAGRHSWDEVMYGR